MLPTKFSPRGDGVWLGVMADLVRRRKGDSGEDRNAEREAARLRVFRDQCTVVGMGEQARTLAFAQGSLPLTCTA